jgi:hypothetical protein
MAKANGTGVGHVDGLSSQEDVEQAMHSLSRMELQFLNEAKRQRLAVEASELGTLAAKQDYKRAGHCVPEESSQHMDILSRPNNTSKNGKGSPGVAEGVVPAEIEAEERGAKRQPPVHSSHLPLPWTGRLGYVSIPSRTKHDLFILNPTSSPRTNQGRLASTRTSGQQIHRCLVLGHVA